MPMHSLIALVSLTLFTAAATAQTFTVCAYNVESGGASAPTVADVVEEIDGVDLWAFSEVQNATWLSSFTTAAGADENATFDSVLGTTGGGDRLGVVFNTSEFVLIDDFELDWINIGGNVRAPLVAHLRLTDGGTEFLFVVNHLYRSRSDRRHQQARELNDWAETQTLPVITAGDFNFDWDAEDGDTFHDRGYDELTEDNVFEWIRPPSPLIKTHDSHHNSVLDFVFASGDAKVWNATSEIIVRAGDFPDDNTTSDHRPVRATFDVGDSRDLTSAELRGKILDRIASMEAEIAELRALAEALTSDQ